MGAPIVTPAHWWLMEVLSCHNKHTQTADAHDVEEALERHGPALDNAIARFLLELKSELTTDTSPASPSESPQETDVDERDEYREHPRKRREEEYNVDPLEAVSSRETPHTDARVRLSAMRVELAKILELLKPDL